MLKLLSIVFLLTAGQDTPRFQFLREHIINLTADEADECEDDALDYQVALLKCSHPLVGVKCDKEEIKATEHDVVECVNAYRKMKLAEENEKLMKMIDEATDK